MIGSKTQEQVAKIVQLVRIAKMQGTMEYVRTQLHTVVRHVSNSQNLNSGAANTDRNAWIKAETLRSLAEVSVRTQLGRPTSDKP